MDKINKNIAMKSAIAVVLVIVAILSFTAGSNYFSSPDFHAKTIEKLDEKKTTVMELTAGSAAVSAAISFLPGDVATPIAEKLADISTYLLWVLCAIYLEKYLVTITGYAAFKLLFPVACICMAIFIFSGSRVLKRIAYQLAAFGLLIFLLIPASVKVSDMIEDTYQASIQSTMDSAENAENDVNGTDDADSSDDAKTDDADSTGGTASSDDAKADSTEDAGDATSGGITDWISNAVDSVEGYAEGVKEKVSDTTEAVTETISDAASGELLEKAEDAMNKFIEATAVLIVTSCIIPLLVLVFFVWIMKMLLEMNMNMTLPISMGFMKEGHKKEGHKEHENRE